MRKWHINGFNFLNHNSQSQHAYFDPINKQSRKSAVRLYSIAELNSVSSLSGVTERSIDFTRKHHTSRHKEQNQNLTILFRTVSGTFRRWGQWISKADEWLKITGITKVKLALVGYILGKLPSQELMLHQTVLHDDYSRNTVLQHCCDIDSNGCNIVPTLQRCVVQKIVVENRPV